ncbi:iron ABC transporter permease [Rhizobium sp. L1K21]|uniref:ABC transporter permease n=1 Tax=Rhizobium sp. L1K21 TaxID=2954933 RepID=UPI002093D3E5|nr:iron ABC transporter permease [Rhizobium sp. L1K21]MCO6187073.1 iron ABC transporter permease [Rhizobium sp. L1K21]
MSELSQNFANKPVARRGIPLLNATAILVSAILALPIAAIIWIAFSGDNNAWPHIVENVIPRASFRTLILLLSTSLLTLVTGVVAAWLSAACDFPFRRVLTVALVLPLAMPTYLAAYAFGEFFDYTGPLQSAVRALFSFKTSRDYWFPDIRSTGGAVFVLGSVLYPYIYLTARSMFLMQGRAAADVARTLGAGPLRTFLRVQLPMARPAIIVGLMLVMMETLNDIGAVEYLGVKTLTFSIYETWLNRGDLAGAAQIATVLLAIVVIIISAERHARRQQRFVGSRQTSAQVEVARIRLKGVPMVAAVALMSLPMIAGFLIPAGVMASYAIKRLDQFLSARLLDALITSVLIAFVTAVLTAIAAFTLVYARRVRETPANKLAGRLATFGYGVPGTVLAIGVLIPLARFDNFLSATLKDLVGISPGLILSGTGFAIVYACAARFLTMAEGSIDSGFQKLSPNLDMAARTLGRTQGQALRQVLIPMMRPAALTAGLLVFIETMKELSATILLRPFNFNTLATLVYEDASRSRVADASVASIIIILVGLVPVIAVSRSLDKG